jgi:hypothetical protein
VKGTPQKVLQTKLPPRLNKSRAALLTPCTRRGLREKLRTYQEYQAPKTSVLRRLGTARTKRVESTASSLSTCDGDLHHQRSCAPVLAVLHRGVHSSRGRRWLLLALWLRGSLLGQHPTSRLKPIWVRITGSTSFEAHRDANAVVYHTVSPRGVAQLSLGRGQQGPGIPWAQVRLLRVGSWLDHPRSLSF